MSATRALAIVAVTLVLAPGFRAEEDGPVRLTVEETRLVAPHHVVVKKDVMGHTLHLVSSPDRRHLAYVAERERQQVVAVDGVEGKAYDLIRGNPVFSPDGRRVANVAGSVREGKILWRVVVDGVEGKEYDDIARFAPAVVFSPDGKRVAYVAVRGERRPALAARPNLGSGFVVRADGYLVTCAHVLEDAAVIRVTVGGKT
jgi:WD40-like Beta Propeller Repeat